LAAASCSRSIAEKAAALTEAVAGRNHGFTDGNKRTAVICVGILLNNSGYQFSDLVDDDEIEEVMLRVAGSEISFQELVTWFRQGIEPLQTKRGHTCRTPALNKS